MPAGLRAAVADLCEQLHAAVEEGAGHAIASSSDDPLVQRLAHLANSVVTAGRHALQRAQAKEYDLRDAHRVARIGTWRRRLDTGVLHWSDELHHLFGTDPASFVPTHEHVMALIHPDDRAMVQGLRAAAMRPDGVGHYRVEFRFRFESGEVRWIESVGRTVFEPSGEGRRATHVLGAMLDVTDRVRARRLGATGQRWVTDDWTWSASGARLAALLS